MRTNLNIPKHLLGIVPALIAEPTSPLDNMAETIRQLVEKDKFHPKAIVENYLRQIFGNDKDFGINWQIS